MARLFVTPREINFIADITREVVKDVVGQRIFYYPISELKTKAHTIYNEAPEKVFDNPLEIEALVGQVETTHTANQFGLEVNFKIEVYVQHRDLINKGIEPSQGDFFSYGPNLYEIKTIEVMRTIYGEVEYKDGIKFTGVKARESNLKVKILGPTDERYTDADAVQAEFVQKRGFSENKEGPTGDQRDLQKSGVLDKPLTGPAEVSSQGDPEDVGNSFYGEGDDR